VLAPFSWSWNGRVDCVHERGDVVRIVVIASLVVSGGLLGVTVAQVVRNPSAKCVVGTAAA
jgi:hypothetical protein